jgi:hypothetical protein
MEYEVSTDNNDELFASLHKAKERGEAFSLACRVGGNDTHINFLPTHIYTVDGKPQCIGLTEIGSRTVRVQIELDCGVAYLSDQLPDLNLESEI